MNTKKHLPRVSGIESLRRISLSSRALEQHRFLGDIESEREMLCKDLLTEFNISKYAARKILNYQPLHLPAYRDLLKEALSFILKKPEFIPLWQEYHELLYVVHSALGYEYMEIQLMRQVVNSRQCQIIHYICSEFSTKALPVLNEYVSENMIFEKYPIQNNLVLRYADEDSKPYIIINKEFPMKGIFGGAEWKI